MLALMLFAIALAASGAKDLRFTNNYRYFFSEDNPNLEGLERIQRTYTKADMVMFVLQPKDGLATDPETLKIVGEMTEAAWQMPLSIRVDSLTNFQHTIALDDDLVVGDLVADPANVSPAEALQVAEIAMREPATALRLLSADGRTTAVIAQLQFDDDDQVALKAIMEHARQMKRDFMAANPGLTIAITGTIPLSNAFNEAAQSDVSTLVPLMFLILALAIYLLTRSLTGTIAGLAVVTLSAAAAMGSAGHLGIALSPPSVLAPIVILTIAVADSIHVLITTLVEMRNGKKKRDAIVESLRVNMAPVFLTSLTTIIGFLSLRFSDAPPIRDLGTISAIGTGYAWLLSITVLPILLMILPLSAKKTVESQSAWLTKFAEPVIRLRYVLFTLFVGAAIAAGTVVPKLTFNDRFVEYFDERIEFRTDSDFAADNLTGIYQLHYSAGAADSGGIADPTYLAQLDGFASWLRAQDGVRHVASFTDVMKRVNKSMHGDDERAYRLPIDRELAAQYLLLYEMSLPYGLDLNDQINVDKSATRLIATLDDISTSELQVLRTNAQAYQRETLPPYMYSAGDGTAVMFSFIGRNNFKAMKLGTAVAFALISLCLIIALRDLKLGVLILVPNAAPPLLAFGIFALFQTEIGFWSTFVVATALGLIVDATVHFLSKYQRAVREQNASAQDAVRYAFRTVGTALLVSTLVLVAGFTVLAQSAFRVNAMLGATVALTVAVALIVDFLLLPALLIILDRRTVSRQKK
jgi:predicted RND superfamily exporter protein